MVKRKYATRITAIAGMVIFIGLALLLVLKINPIIESYLNIRIASLFRNDPSSLYSISYDSLKINIYSGNIMVKNLKIRPRQNILDSLLANNPYEKNVLDANISHIGLVDLKWVEFLKTGEVELDKIEFYGGTVKHYHFMGQKNQRPLSIGSDIFTPNFKSALIHKFDLDQATFQYFRVQKDTVESLSFKGLSLSYEEFFTDSTLLKNRPGFNIRNIHLQVDSLVTGLVKNYTIHCDHLSFASKANQFKFSGIGMTPSKEKIADQNYLKLRVKEMELYKLNYDSLIHKGMVLADRINITEPYFNYVRPPQKLQKDTTRVLPATTFRNIPFPIAIDTLAIRGGTFDFLKHGYGEPTVDLIAENLSLDGLFFSSDPVLLNKNNTFYISARAIFMKQAAIETQFVFPLLHPKDSFAVNLRMDTLDAHRLNPILKNGKGIMMNAGRINQLKMALFGTSEKATGHLSMDYQNLKIEVVKIDETNFANSSKKGFLTFMVNTLAKSNNTKERSSFNEGIIYLEKAENDTFLDYTLESLMTGVITTMVPESRAFFKKKEKKRR